MTYIEFFDKEAVENICSSLIKAPERVILLGDKQKLMQKHAERYKAVLQARGADVEFVCLTVNKNDIQSIVNVLSETVEKYDDCVFDLTGGEELYLVATGIVFEKNKDRNIQMHRINVRNSTIIDGDRDGHTILSENGPELSVEENIRIHGGDIVYDDQRKGKTFRWDMSADFKKDINSMWNICRADTQLWNTQICVLEAAEILAGQTEELTVSVPAGALKDLIKRRGGDYVTIKYIFESLYNAGLLEEYKINDDIFSVSYKNAQVKRCLTVAGQVLEMKVFLAALEAREDDGTKTYNDVMNGVHIDWDGKLGDDSNGYDTENEIDVLMMHGLVPVFVSCKNGKIDMDELYKLDTVAARFGGKYAKKVLVATSLEGQRAKKVPDASSVGGKDFADHFRQRAVDMGIKLIEGNLKNDRDNDFTYMNDDEIYRLIRSLRSN